jgi:tetratricopeptide (TPR) repeat protein
MTELGISGRNPLDEPRVDPQSRLVAGDLWQFPEADDAIDAPCFIHSSWRTGKTWFSLQFRHFPQTQLFYEPFNESLAGMSPAEAVQNGPQSWESGHPGSAAYWREYVPLLRKSGGIRLFRPEMSYDWFFPIGGPAGELRAAELKYLAFLARFARRRRQIPVFAFSRSLGRIIPIRRHFPGKHIVVTRNLWDQWLSYLANRQRGNPYFIDRLASIIVADDPFIEYLHDFYLGAKPVAGGQAVTAPAPCSQNVAKLFPSLSDADLFSIFTALHLYLYLHARIAADLFVDSTRLASDNGYRQAMTCELRELTGLRLSLGDARQRVSLAVADHAVNRDRLESHARIAVSMCGEGQDQVAALRFAEGLLEEIYERRSSQEYFAPLRKEVSLVTTENERLRAVLDERAAALAAAEARAGGAEASLTAVQAEFAALRGQFAQAQQQGEERTAALAQAETEIAELRLRAGALDAATAAAEARAGTAEAGLAEAQSELARRGADEFALRGEIESMRRALRRAERQHDERAAEVEPLRVEVAAQRTALAAAQDHIRGVEARLAEARQESEARRAQPAAAQTKPDHDAAIGTIKAELAALRGEVSAAGQVGHALFTAATVAGAAPQRQKDAMRPALGGLGAALQARAIANGDRARDAKDWRAAARHYKKALARNPANAPCWVQYGHALKESGRLPEAEAAYRRALAYAPDVADTYLQLGHALKLQGDENAAQAAYLRALALDPAMTAAADELVGLGWSPQHLAQLRRLAANPGIARLRATREEADAARDRRDWRAAARLYREYTAADPGAFDIAVQQGHALKELGDLAGAAEAYYRVLDARPQDDDLHLQIGHLEKLRRDYAAAAEHYQKAAELNPRNADARREADALRHRVRELHPGAAPAPTTGPGRADRAQGGPGDGDDLAFLDARAGEIYQQLLSAMG